MAQLVVTTIKDFLKKLKGGEAASVAYPPTEGTIPRQIPEPSFVGEETQLRHSGLSYPQSTSVCGSDLTSPGYADHVSQEWVGETGPRSGLEYSSDEERRQ